VRLNLTTRVGGGIRAEVRVTALLTPDAWHTAAPLSLPARRSQCALSDAA
jgi:hypothetical protein